jgi:hypothetical protein
MLLMQVLVHTPRWVFILFFVLLAFGISQLVARAASLMRVSVLPVVMVALSLHGVATAFASQGMALLAWALPAAAAAGLVLARPLPAGTRYDAATRSFALPGSALPLALMMGIFFTKYAVGVSLAMVPELARAGSFALAISALYGAFSGVFLGRAIRLWRLATRASNAVASAA